MGMLTYISNDVIKLFVGSKYVFDNVP